jgi:hypothetical protein
VAAAALLIVVVFIGIRVLYPGLISALGILVAIITVIAIPSFALIDHLQTTYRRAKLGKEVEDIRDRIRWAIERGEISRLPEYIRMPAWDLFTKEERELDAQQQALPASSPAAPVTLSDEQMRKVYNAALMSLARDMRAKRASERPHGDIYEEMVSEMDALLDRTKPELGFLVSQLFVEQPDQFRRIVYQPCIAGRAMEAVVRLEPTELFFVLLAALRTLNDDKRFI